jgi:hypothetical protein
MTPPATTVLSGMASPEALRPSLAPNQDRALSIPASAAKSEALVVLLAQIAARALAGRTA